MVAVTVTVRTELAVDEVVQVVGRPLQELVGLRLRDRAGLDCRVELRLRVGRQRLLEAVDRLALCLGDLGERLPRFELRAKLRLRQAEVLRGRFERGRAVMAEAKPPPR